MNPRGKTKVLIDAMKAQPEKALWSRSECAAAMGIEVDSITVQLKGALRREWLFKHDLGDRRVAYSLQPPEVEAPEFQAALWGDGDLTLQGVELREDGSVLLTAEHVAVVRRLLTGGVPA